MEALASATNNNLDEVVRIVEDDITFTSNLVVHIHSHNDLVKQHINCCSIVIASIVALAFVLSTIVVGVTLLLYSMF